MKELDSLTHKFIDFIPNLLSALLVIILFLAIWFLAKKMTANLNKYFDQEKEYISTIITRIIKISILIIGIITTLDVIGISIGGLITSLGLTGFAIGFALKDVLANIASGILLLIYKPFSIGNKISAFGVEGKVINIDIRYTTLKSDNKIELIPNSKLLTEKITILDK